MSEAYPRAVNVERLIRGIWGATPPADPADTLRKTISLARQAVKPLGYSIQGVPSSIFKPECGSFRLRANPAAP